jgi:hypothetical protein
MNSPLPGLQSRTPRSACLVLTEVPACCYRLVISVLCGSERTTSLMWRRYITRSMLVAMLINSRRVDAPRISNWSRTELNECKWEKSVGRGAFSQCLQCRVMSVRFPFSFKVNAMINWWCSRTRPDIREWLVLSTKYYFGDKMLDGWRNKGVQGCKGVIRQYKWRKW